MNSKLVVLVAALVLVVVLGPLPSSSAGLACINNFCDSNPSSPTSLACTGLCLSAGYSDGGICSSQPHGATCTCSGDDGDPTVPLMDTICQNAFCEAGCTSCGYAHYSCKSLEEGGGRKCTCSN